MEENKSQFDAHPDLDQKGWTAMPNILIRDGTILSNTAFRLLSYLISNQRSWQVYKAKVRKDLCWGREMLDNAIKELESKGYILRTPMRNLQNRFTHDKFEYHVEPVFKGLKKKIPVNSKKVSDDGLADVGKVDVGQPAPTKTNSGTSSLRSTKSNVKNRVFEETMPSACADEKKDPVSPKAEKSKYPLKKEQIPLFDRIKRLVKDTDDDTIMVWVRTHEAKKINDALRTLEESIQKMGDKIRSRGAMMRKFLQGDCVLVDENTVKNRAEAQTFKDLYNLNHIKIGQKYVTCENTGKDLALNMEPLAFGEHFANLIKLHELYSP